MNRPIVPTFILAIVALITAGGAAYFYPWPEIENVSEKVNQPLFAEFTNTQVRSIEIAKFNSDRQSLEKIIIQRKGEKWVIPGAADFNANNAAQVARAINSVVDRKVLELVSDEQQDHLKNGVIDPDEFQSVELRGGLGQRITLKDRNGQILANLIVGSPFQNSEQQSLYCVRIPGQPQVYSVEFDLAALTTRFQDWVDPNLFRLRTQSSPEGLEIASYEVDSYRIDSTKIAEAAPRSNLYRAVIARTVNQFGVRELTVPDGEGWKPIAPSARLAELLVRDAGGQLFAMTFPEIRPKPKPIADALRAPGNVDDPALFVPMHEFGFRQVAAAGAPIKLESTGGELDLSTIPGVSITAYFGNVVGSAHSTTKLNRMMVLLARADESALAKPSEPKNDDGSPLTEQQQKDFQRETQAWDKKIKAAQDLAAELNQTYAPWYYALSDDVYSRLLPDLPGLAASTAAPPPSVDSITPSK